LRCTEREIYSYDGRRCTKCPPHTRPKDRKLKCEADECIFSKFIIGVDGKCKSCEPGFVKDETLKNCIPDKSKQIKPCSG